jgi:hypothetical protein
MKKIVSVFLALVLLNFPAYAEVCYSTAEAEAEQGIRIHSELMVIGLNCQHMTPAGQKNYYAQYRDFTARYESLFKAYEETLINYYRRAGRANPVGALNDLRTDFANKISENAAKMRPDVFCSRYMERIAKAQTMNQNQVKVWAATFYPSHPVSRPVCQ